MPSLQTELLFDSRCRLGEGPLWHPTEHRLYWVDIENNNLYKSNLALNDYTKDSFPTPIGAFGFVKDDGLILATGEGFATWNGSPKTYKALWHPFSDQPDIRMNDGKVDPAGRFWAGTLDPAHSQAALYRLDPDGSRHTLLREIGISNGLGWSPDRKTMYYTDSLRYTIYAFDYDLATSEIHNQRPFIQLPKDDRAIVPDGLCVDAEGCVWSAQWNGWRVVRYSPAGEVLQTVSLPAQLVTSCCFGGPNLDQLFITTAWTDLSPDEHETQPLAGGVFTLKTTTQGQPANFFTHLK
ncbi:SMP-30/gluconolactonase/LRE family protein [Chloroflexota bacterium]|nr:SMP-30/gluconolactonase/LRE family protein [Chloroflexota bacterium]